ncbi:MAG: hypothetical protein HFJ51_00830 [Clostridia bacterium]|nr:hypothetical protein [Clostridia bacterium]
MEDSQISNKRQMENPVTTNANSPEILTNNIYTPAFLRQQIGKLVRVEFLIGTNNLVDRIGILQDVGASYILLRALESNTTIYADIYSIKFVTISNTVVPNNQYYNLYNNSMF